MQSGCYCLACRGLCVPLLIYLPRPSLTNHQIDHAEWYYRQHNILHSFSRPFHICHVLRMNLLLSVKSTGRQWRIFQFCYSMANASWNPRCRAVSTGPTRGHRALWPPSWSLFLIVWSETFTPVACWRSFCRALVMFILFHLAQRNPPVLLMG